MKAQFVYENISFERGTNPKSSMRIGDRVAQYEKMMRPWLEKVEEKAKKFGFVDNTEEVRGIWKNHYPSKFSDDGYEYSEDLVRAWKRKTGRPWKRRVPTIHLVIRELRPDYNERYHVEDANKYGVYYLLLADEDHPVDFPGESWPWFDTDDALQEWTKDKRWEMFVSGSQIFESFNFQRGKEPKESMEIGKAANPFVIEFMEEEFDDEGRVTAPLPEDHNQDTWFESCDPQETHHVLANWKDAVDGAYYFYGQMKDNTDPDHLEHFHAPEFNDEYVEYQGQLYYIPDHSEYWNRIY
jgi:hypothetical protein